MDQTSILQPPSSNLMLYPLLLLVSCLWVLHRWQQQTRFHKLGNMLPGPPTLPFIGNALITVGKSPDDVVDIALNYGKEYGSVVRGWMGPKLLVFLRDANDIEVLLKSQVHIDKSDEYSLLKPWLGDGILLSTGSKWRSHRKMIGATFHINVLKSFIDVFNQNTLHVVEKMRPECGKTFDVQSYVAGTAMDVLLETIMGFTKETRNKSAAEYVVASRKLCDIIHQRHYKFYLRPDFIFNMTSYFKSQKQLLSTIHRLTSQVIKTKNDAYLDNKTKGIASPALEKVTRSSESNINHIGQKKRIAFLDLLLEYGQNGTKQLTDNDLKDEVDTIMFAGHDTITISSSFALCLLGLYQDVQAKVYNELYEIFADSDRPVTYEDTVQMKYLDRVIQETLRLYPTVPIVAREMKKDVKIVTNDYILPAGCTVVIGIFSVHRNPKYFKDPEKFDPDNFLPENTHNRHHYSYIPFSAGPRNCVGYKYALLQLKVLLSVILRNYKCISDIPEDQFKLKADISLKRGDGFQMRVEPRVRVPSSVT